MSSDFDQSVMLALLPTRTDWCKIDIPHLTLVYAGEKKDLPAGSFNELAKEACSLAMLTRPLTLRVIGSDVFGEDKKVDVFKLEYTSELQAMRHFVEHWNRSEHKDFKPHVTIGPTGHGLPENPMFLVFDRLLVGWGDESLTFRMKP